MPTDLPEKQAPAPDRAWLFSKTIIFVVVDALATVVVVASSVALGGLGWLLLASRLVAVALAAWAFLSGMAGRSWLRASLASRLFSVSDLARIERIARD